MKPLRRPNKDKEPLVQWRIGENLAATQMVIMASQPTPFLMRPYQTLRFWGGMFGGRLTSQFLSGDFFPCPFCRFGCDKNSRTRARFLSQNHFRFPLKRRNESTEVKEWTWTGIWIVNLCILHDHYMTYYMTYLHDWRGSSNCQCRHLMYENYIDHLHSSRTRAVPLKW